MPIRHFAALALLALPFALAACGDDASTTSLDAAHVLDTAAADALASDTAAPPDTAAPADSAGPVDTSAPTDTVTSPDTTAPTDTASPTDTAASDDTAAPTDTTVGPKCLTLAPGHARHVVIARPYTDDGAASPRFTVHPLLADAAVGAATATLDLGVSHYGLVAFSPDGGLGFAPHDDGTLSVFALTDDGTPTVLAAGLDPGVYLADVVVDGERLLLVNPNWPASGGGVYALDYDCLGNLGAPTLLYATKNARSVTVRGVDHVVAARAAGDTTFGHLHLMRPSAAGFTRVGGADVFGHDEAVLASLGLTADGRFALVGDNSEFSGLDNAVGVAAVSDTGLVAVTPLAPILDPVALVASPDNDAVLVVSGYGNTVRVLAYTPDAATPFSDLGPPTYVTQKPQLPGDAVRVGGDLDHHVLVVENVALRRFRFDGDAVVTDLGRTAEGSGLAAIPGAFGVQP